MNENERNRKMSMIKVKVLLYFMSLTILFFLLAIKPIDIKLDPIRVDIDILNFVVFMFLGVMGLVSRKYIKSKYMGVQDHPFKIVGIKRENYEYITFLTTYIIPMIGIDTCKIGGFMVMSLMLVLIGFIFIRMDMYYGNPILAVMGFNLYRVTLNKKDKITGENIDRIVLSKDHLALGMRIKWTEIDNIIILAKENH